MQVTVDTAYFSLPVVPTVLGFDPRLQFVHERDGLEVLWRATLGEFPELTQRGVPQTGPVQWGAGFLPPVFQGTAFSADKPIPHLAFQSAGSVGVQPNQLVLTMQPNEGVSLSLVAKIPGTRMKLRPVNMEFLYGTAFLSQSPEAYERLIMDAMRGDATLFTRDDEVEAQWRIIDPILQSWSASDDPVPQYEAGTDGPDEADTLMADGHRWRAI